jgi:hypothetical protein
MTNARRQYFENLLFHGIEIAAERLREAFDIDLFSKLDQSDISFLRKMFLRRHVYEHDGGQATAQYIQKSEDAEFPQGALIRETKENAHRLLGLLNKMASNFDRVFHDIVPPTQEPIQYERDRRSGTWRISKDPRS